MGFFFLALIILGLVIVRVIGGKSLGGSTRHRLTVVLIAIYSVLTAVFLLGILLEGNCTASSSVMSQYLLYMKAEHLLAGFALLCLVGAIILVRRNIYLPALVCVVVPPVGWVIVESLHAKSGVGCMFM